jgi:catalase
MLRDWWNPSRSMSLTGACGRLFSYLDTQITRLAGPNFPQIPINRPHAPVNDMLRDGFHQSAVHRGVAPYRPNSLDGGCPFTAGAAEGAYVEVPLEVSGRKVREAPASFADHFSQPRLFWLSMSPVEREHIIAAYTFELGKCYEQAVKERYLRVLANIDSVLCAQVAEGLGLPAPAASEPLAESPPSPALSQVGQTWPADGRIIGIVAGESDVAALGAVRTLPAQRTFVTARSVEFDALLVAGAPAPGKDAYGARDAKAAGGADAPVDPRVLLMIAETYRHGKPLGGWGTAAQAFSEAGVPAQAPGVLLGEDGTSVLRETLQFLGAHRVWDRFPAAASLT